LSSDTASGGRVAHVTFPKCGSQWVRDVLSDPRISAYSGLELAAAIPKELSGNWAQRPPGTLVAPIYNSALKLWLAQSKPGDKAVYVIRDPRDQIVSWIYSLCYTHRDARGTDVFRDLLLSLDDRGKLALMCEHWRTFYGPFRSLVDPEPSDSFIVARYEELAADGARSFGAIFQFLGWNVPDAVTAEVVGDHSFTSKTGRRPGEEDTGSHLRKGVAGDWRSYFDALTGRFFEHRYDSILVGLGYEQSRSWWQDLPERAGGSFS